MENFLHSMGVVSLTELWYGKPLLESSPSKVIFFEAEYLWVK